MRSVIEYIHMKSKTPLQILFHEMKYQSMEWKLPKEPSPKKIKASRSATKVMLAVLWDAKGNILADYFACRHEPILNEYYLFRSHKVSKAGNGKEKKKQAFEKNMTFSSKTMHRNIGQVSPWQQ